MESKVQLQKKCNNIIYNEIFFFLVTILFNPLDPTDFDAVCGISP